jgi:hypothetical protein
MAVSSPREVVMPVSEFIFIMACGFLGVWFLEVVPYSRLGKAITGGLWILVGLSRLVPAIFN